MPSIPIRAIPLISLVTSYLIVSQEPGWSRRQLLGTFVTTCAFQLFCWGVWAVILYPRYFSPLRDLPGPSGNSFLFGQFQKIRKEPSGIPQREWVQTIPNDGLIRYLGPWNTERLLVTSPKAISDLLVTHSYDFVKPREMQVALSRILGVGVLVAEGDEHRFQRKKLMPAFAFRHIKDLYPVFWAKSREAVQAMTDYVGARNPDPEKATKTGVIEAGDWASRAALDIIGVSGLGRDFGAIKDPSNELNQTYKNVFTPTKQAQILALLNIFLPLWLVRCLPVKRNNDILEASQMIRSVCMDMIQEKKGKLLRKEPTDVDILSVALESGAFTDEKLVDQLMTFLAAGHETTATAMTWTTYLLAKHPEVQTRLRQEIREHLPSPDSDTDISSLDIDHLPYLNAVCSEGLRYYSPVPLTFREAGPNAYLLGRKIPEGTRITIVPWAVHYDTGLWGADAAEFNPDRWLQKSEGGEEGGKDKFVASGGASSNFAMLTFLHGPRSCIGQSFSRAEFACLLACWVGRFEFALKNEEDADEKKIEIKGGVTARPAKGMYLQTTVVDGW